MSLYPCKTCTKHRSGCHDVTTCPEWAAVVREREAWTAANAERIRTENDVNHFKTQMVYRARRKK